MWFYFFIFLLGKHILTDSRFELGTFHLHTPFTIETGLNGYLVVIYKLSPFHFSLSLFGIFPLIFLLLTEGTLE